MFTKIKYPAYKYIKAFKEITMYSNKYVLELIKDGINEEPMVSRFYADLANSVRDIDDKKMLEEMSLDEKKHYEMLSDIYTKLTNEKYMPKEIDMPQIDKDFVKHIVNSIKAELNTVEAYRPILFALENQQFKNFMMEIISDEQNHAAKLNYMYSKYR